MELMLASRQRGTAVLRNRSGKFEPEHDWQGLRTNQEVQVRRQLSIFEMCEACEASYRVGCKQHDSFSILLQL